MTDIDYKEEAFQLTISIDQYNQLLNDIEKSIPHDKSYYWWSIMEVLESNKKLVNTIEGKWYPTHLHKQLHI